MFNFAAKIGFLCGEEWYQAHYLDQVPEPTMDVFVDGKIVGHIEGKHKRDAVETLLQPYTTKIRVGHKICIVPVGEEGQEQDGIQS